MNLEELKKEYAEQDNRITAYPIFVSVQELVCIGVMANGYSVRCPYGDGETVCEFKHPKLEEAYETKEEILDALEESGLNAEDEKYDIEEINVGYIWTDVEFFLTIKGAEEYIKADAHNHGKLRTYVNHFNQRNFEMNGLLKTLGFKTED